MKYEEIFVGMTYACGPSKSLTLESPRVKRVLVKTKGVNKDGISDPKSKYISATVFEGDESFEAVFKHTSFLVEWAEFLRIQHEKYEGLQERLRQREIRQQHLDERVKAVMARLRGLGMSHYVQRNCPRSDVTVEVEVLEKLLDRCDLLASGATPTLY